MAKDLLEELRTASRNVLIIGSAPISNPESWNDLRAALFSRLDTSDIRIDVIAESSNQLFQHSLRSDTPHASGTEPRTTFSQLEFRRNLLEKELNRTPLRRSRCSFTLCMLPLPIYVARVDGRTWYLPVTAYTTSLQRFKLLESSDPWFEMVQDYVSRLAAGAPDAKYLSQSDSELLELFDQERIPRGIYPRDCFYDTDHYQYVVWDFVFSRAGELLIHRRSENAKDNQGMWDKSVGGHIDFSAERSSEDAAGRELIEELYTKEKEQQSGHEYSLLSEDVAKVHYLGHWRLEGRGPEYLNHVAELEEGTSPGEEPWVFFKIPGTVEHNTPRILPDGRGVRRLRVLVDVFVFVSNTILTPEYAEKQLFNSKFQLVEMSTLKTWIEQGKDDRGAEFKVTPDLEYVMTGRLRNALEEVSQMIKYAAIRR